MTHPLLMQLAGRPLALAPRALDGLLSATSAPERSCGVLSLFDTVERAAPEYTLAEGGIAVVPVLGPLVTRGDWLTAFLGAMSYDEVADAIGAAFADPSSRGVLLEMDSPGVGLSETARPAVIVLDADEAAEEDEPRGRPGRAPQLVVMTPELFVLAGRPAAEIGAELNAFRRRIVRRVLTDAALIGLTGPNGLIRYAGCATALAAGRSMHALVPTQLELIGQAA